MHLRLSFYLLAIAQFVGFAALKIRSNASAWVACASVSTAIAALLVLHNALAKRSLRRRGTPIERLSVTSVRARLLGGDQRPRSVEARGAPAASSA